VTECFYLHTKSTAAYSRYLLIHSSPKNVKSAFASKRETAIL